MNSNIFVKIKEQNTSLTRKQRMVASYMQEHPDEMAYITLKELSRKIGVTEITILNTCTSLGYEGYNEVKYEFRKAMIQNEKTDVMDDRDRYSETVPKYEQDNHEKVLFEIGNEETKAIADYWKHVELKYFFEAAELVMAGRQIFLCGRGISYSVAEFMKNRLASCDIFGVTINTELNDEVYSMFSAINEESLVVAISFPDYYFMTDKVTEYARTRKAKILAITDRQDSNVARCADIVLTVPTATRIFLNTLTGPMLLLNLLTSAIKLRQGKIAIPEEEISQNEQDDQK